MRGSRLAALVAVAIVVSGGAARAGGGDGVKLTAELERPRCLVGEGLSLRVIVENGGTTSLELPDPFHARNWQPTYEVRGPQHPGGVVFSHRSVRADELGPPGGDPVLTRLEPGQRLEGEVPLLEWCPLEVPGEYEVRVRLEWQGTRAEAAPLTFSLERPRVGAAVLATDPGGSKLLWCAWTHAPAQATGARLQDLVARYERDGLEPAPSTPTSVELPADAQLLPVEANFDRSEVMFRWRAWVEGGALVAGAPTPEPHVARLELEDRVTPVRPALMPPDGTLDVFVVHPDGDVSLVRFPAPHADLTVAAPTEVWRVRRRAAPVAATACLPREGAAGPRHLLLVDQDAEGLVLELLTCEGTRPPAGGRTVRERGARLVPGSQPALRVDGDGVPEAALVIETQGQLALLSVRVDPEDPQPIGRERLLGPALPAVLEAAVACDRADQSPQATWSWALLLEGGRLLHAGAAGPVEPLGGPVVRPLQLARMDATFVLVAPADQAPSIMPLR